MTKDDYAAIDEDAALYGDDVGGQLFLDGQDGLKLEPMIEAQNTTARRIAYEIFESIRQWKT